VYSILWSVQLTYAVYRIYVVMQDVWNSDRLSIFTDWNHE